MNIYHSFPEDDYDYEADLKLQKLEEIIIAELTYRSENYDREWFNRTIAKFFYLKGHSTTFIQEHSGINKRSIERAINDFDEMMLNKYGKIYKEIYKD